MDDQRFDRFVKAMAAPGPRRAVLGALAGGALGVAGGAVGARRAAAQSSVAGCRERYEACTSRGQCCEAEAGVACRPVSQDCENGRDTRACCGLNGARCSGDCDCCQDFTCIDRRCRRRVAPPV